MGRHLVQLSVIAHRGCPQIPAMMEELQQPHRGGLPSAAIGKLGLAARVQRRKNFVLRQIFVVDVAAGFIACLTRHLCKGLVGEIVIRRFGRRIGRRSRPRFIPDRSPCRSRRVP